MVRAAFRHLTPKNSRDSDPAAAFVGGLTGSLNQALIRNQQNQQAKDMANQKQNSALDMLMAKFNEQKMMAEDPNKKAPKPYYAPSNSAGGANAQHAYFKTISDQVNKASASRKSYIAQGLKSDKYGMLQPGTPEFTQTVHQLDDEWQNDPSNKADAFIVKNAPSIQAAIAKGDKASLNTIFTQLGGQQDQAATPAAPTQSAQPSGDASQLPFK